MDYYEPTEQDVYECTGEYWRRRNRALELERLESESAEIEYNSRVRLEREEKKK